MFTHVLAVFDSATQAYGRPIVVPSRGVGVRSFSDEVQRADPGNAMYNHPGDFELHAIGGFDDMTGALTSIKPELLVRAKDISTNRT